MAEGVSVVDLDGKITYCNPAAAGLLGYAQEELIGKHWSVLVPSGSRDVVRAADERRKKGLADHYEIQMLRKDGTRVEVFVGGSPIYTGGVLMGTIAVFTDFTGLRTAESRIKEQAALIDKARDVIIVTDVSGTITYWNSSAESTYGWTAAEAAGKNVHELLHDEGDRTSTEAGRVILEKGQWSGELHHTARDSRVVIMQSRWTLVNDAEGFPRSIMMINTDVTEKVKLEKQFLRAQRMESLGTLASGIAHDLNNVLSPIIMALQILRDKRTDERERTLLTTMELSAKRGSDIVKQVLMFARGAEGKHEELQLRHVIREMETIVRETFPKSIECRIDVPKDLWPVSGDPTQLHQVLLNLCVNARDAMMPEGGMLKIAAENVELDNYELQLQPEKRSGQYIVVSVTDTGCGMTQDTMMKIFEPFFTTKGVGKGTGLGLSTVNGIIKGHGGFINVYSEPHVGSTFRLYLPAVPQGASGKKPEQVSTLPTGRGQTILLVDDEPAIRQIAKGTLETYGYRVLTAGDGEEAEEVYRAHMNEVVLVITDMMMPVRDGKETIRVLKKINPRLKIVVTSGLVSTEKEDDGWHKHTQAFLAKPFTAEKLLNTLRDVLEVQKN
jgi:PAS domain S-box-containing protein